ncbi:hypothetical protein CCM_06405 [Cordyceps militaris CM01]|uniref:Uncharacterized protein n=2 Tax=Cordyceps militaris TaxID=73501 RepID=G3JKG6_CORMM|nr:uncharacterized protein CCM_06405 [Cordyceps militaris CM01]ATY58655.1 hypothetical protein A9K55_003761 [Cordyceps militaris]EGX92244.1 hypothetical protein CCM_06405 [Cordyceps militaris CM01]
MHAQFQHILAAGLFIGATTVVARPIAADSLIPKIAVLEGVINNGSGSMQRQAGKGPYIKDSENADPLEVLGSPRVDGART